MPLFVDLIEGYLFVTDDLSVQRHPPPLMYQQPPFCIQSPSKTG